MRYFLHKVKDKRTGEVREGVLLVREGEDPGRVMGDEELVSQKEISEVEATTLCGRVAILGE